MTDDTDGPARLKAAVDDLAQVPEALRPHYAPADGGGYVLAVEPVSGWALEDVDGLKSALGKERRRADEAEGRLKAFGDLEPEAARRALETLGGDDPEQALEARLADRLQAATAERDARIERLTSDLERQLVDSAAARALAEHRGSVELLLPHVRERVRVRRGEDGATALEVVDGDGHARLGDANGALMTVAQLVAEMKGSPAFARAFDGSGQSGGGTPADGPDGGPRRISLGDQAALNGNLQAVARGEIAVTD